MAISLGGAPHRVVLLWRCRAQQAAVVCAATADPASLRYLRARSVRPTIASPASKQRRLSSTASAALSGCVMLAIYGVSWMFGWPEGRIRRQRLGIGHVEHRVADLHTGQRGQPVVIDQLRPATDVHETRSLRQHREQPRVESVSGSKQMRMSVRARKAGSSSAPAWHCTPSTACRDRLHPAQSKPRPTSCASRAWHSEPSPRTPTRRSLAGCTGSWRHCTS